MSQSLKALLVLEGLIILVAIATFGVILLARKTMNSGSKALDKIKRKAKKSANKRF